MKLSVFFYEGKWKEQGAETFGLRERMAAGLMAGVFRCFPDVQRVVSAVGGDGNG